jgi:hypothetical protein
MLLPLAFVIAQNTAPSNASACSGADPSITGAKVTSTTPRGDMNQISVTVTVVNNGSMSQQGNTLQSVDVYQNNTKVDRKGLPPLKGGQAYTFPYVFDRAADAGTGTTDLRFQLVFTQPNPPGAEDCSTANDTYRIKV